MSKKKSKSPAKQLSLSTAKPRDREVVVEVDIDGEMYNATLRTPNARAIVGIRRDMAKWVLKNNEDEVNYPMQVVLENLAGRCLAACFVEPPGAEPAEMDDDKWLLKMHEWGGFGTDIVAAACALCGFGKMIGVKHSEVDKIHVEYDPDNDATPS